MKNDPLASGELPTQRSDDGEEPIGDAFVFSVVEGPNVGAVYVLDPSAPARMLIGKSVTCSLRVDDREVSRRHASLRPEGKGVLLTDLGSTNGTRVNNVSVREAQLEGGETLRVGRTVITVSRAAPEHATLTPETSFGRFLGQSRAMRGLYPLLRHFAAQREDLLLEGETGTGKQLLAEELHAHSARAHEPFMVVDAQALDPAAIEKVVADARASAGTVFVHEAAALPYGLQRYLATSQGHARLIYGTRRDLDRDVERGAFREELLVRLAPFRIELPPLRERAGDVDFLARAFWEALAGEQSRLPSDFAARFHRYRWPGNVRELTLAVAARYQQGEHGLRQPTALSRDDVDTIGAIVDRELPLAQAKELVIDELERRYVRHMLDRHGTTKDAAAAANVGVRYFQILRAKFSV